MTADDLDTLFRQAVEAVDRGDETALGRVLASRPRLAGERLGTPGAWLRDTVGAALDGFFARPFLLWFVAEDPVRNGRLPPNIASIARLIIDAARDQQVDTFQEQLDHALRLVCWSWIARQCGRFEALKAAPPAWERWQELSYTHQREHVDAIEEAVRGETRARGIGRAVEMLRQVPRSTKRAGRQQR